MYDVQHRYNIIDTIFVTLILLAHTENINNDI